MEMFTDIIFKDSAALKIKPSQNILKKDLVKNKYDILSCQNLLDGVDLHGPLGNHSTATTQFQFRNFRPKIFNLDPIHKWFWFESKVVLQMAIVVYFH